MKTKLLLFLATFFGTLSAQNLTLTRSLNEPSVGDVNSVYSLDTSFYTAGLPSNISGNGVTWDFSNLIVTPTLVTSNYVSPQSITTVTPPSQSTFAEEQNGSYTFFKSTTTPTTQTELLSLKTGTLALNFTNSAIVAKYPISYGYSLTDAISGTVTFTFNPTFSGNLTTTADGQGTLIMPQGHTYNNVLRMKSVQNITITIIIQQIVIKQTTYSYYSSYHKFPILTVNCSNTGTTQTTSATGNSAFLDVGLKENSLKSVNFNIYPNPAINSVSVMLENNKTAESAVIVNSIGQKVKTFSATNKLDISDLPRGVYFVEVRSKGYSGRKPLVITE